MSLIERMNSCRLCEKDLPLEPNPIFSIHSKSKIILVSQAPGLQAHNKNKAWKDAGGERLRQWFDVDEEQFYNPLNFAFLPMGLCYPGRGKSGDLPPMKICAPTWMESALSFIEEKQVIFLIGGHSQNYFLKDTKSLTHRVKYWKNYLPQYIPLPHPSPRNNIWLSKNSWFEKDVLPDIQNNIGKMLNN